VKALWCAAGVAIAAGCASPTGPPPAPAATIAGVESPSEHGPGNIYWRPRRLSLPYPSKAHAEAVLSYWGPDGYFTETSYCKNGGRFSATPHRQYGNPSKYRHVVYWFKALSPGPDDCTFTVVLDNTGSPPIAILRLHIAGG
jgi:hypothetical protein